MYVSEKKSIETWEDIIGYEGFYQVSNKGRVKSLARYRHSGEGGYVQRGRLLKNQKGSKYLHVSLCKKGVQKTTLLHRIIAKAFIPNPGGNPQINHIDGNKLNNAISNLEWVTCKENHIHARKYGLIIAPSTSIKKGQYAGEKHPAAKLTEFQVQRIRLMKEIDATVTYKKIGKIFNVTAECIYLIVKRKNWSHIK